MVARFSSTGSQLLYATYIGGSGNDEVMALDVDARGVIWIAGSTSSTDYPTTYDAFQNSNLGVGNGVITAIDPGRNLLPYSTYVGDENGTTLNDVVVSSTGKIAVAGFYSSYAGTTSINFPVGSLDTIPDSEEGLVIEFNNPINTVTGTDVTVTPIDDTDGDHVVSLTFPEVLANGSTTLQTAPTGPAEPQGFTVTTRPNYYYIDSTAEFTGQVEMCIYWTEGDYADESVIALMHYDDTVNQWVNITSSVDTVNNKICGLTSSFSPFVIMQQTNPYTATFLSPLNPTGTNTVKIGQTLPIKIQVNRRSNNASVDDATVVLHATKLTTGANGNPIDIDQSTVGAPDSGIYFNLNQQGHFYKYNLRTTSLTPGTYRFDAIVNGIQTTSVNVVMVNRN
jgi:hypothetical protein